MPKEINNKIKKFRKEKKMTLQQLADLTDFTKGYLSRIENSTDSPRLPTLQKIARALEIDIGVFFEEQGKTQHQPHPHPHHIDLVNDEGEGGTHVIESSAAYSYRPLVHNFSGKYMAPYLLSVKKGHTKRFNHDSEELIYLISGSVRMTYGGKEFRLNSGDSVYFDSRWEHQLFNDSEEVAVMLNVIYDYRRF